MKQLTEMDKNMQELIRNEIRISRNKFLKRKRKKPGKNLDKPVAYWIKEDRLLNGKGKELTIILKTRGCSWALGEEGGCAMCGYIKDSACRTVKDSSIISQFDHALAQSKAEIESDSKNYIVKIFNSGSFFDEEEVSPHVRKHICSKLSEIKKVKEVVVESRVEYLDKEILKEFNNNLGPKYLEIGIGLETVDDFIRNVYINKGLQFKDFQSKVQILNKLDIGIRAYLLFKPPFLNEQAAIDDCIQSIQTLKKMKIDTISINPVNIQSGSYVEYLWRRGFYRAPWFYSLFEAITSAVSQKDLESLRVISDPSGAGSKRGIHNCLKGNCNWTMKDLLHEFVLSQEIDDLELKETECPCKIQYQFQKNYNYHLRD